MKEAATRVKESMDDKLGAGAEVWAVLPSL